MSAVSPESPRLVFRLLAPEDLPVLLALARDEHVRRFLLDGACVSEAWCAELIAASCADFGASKLGMWLVFERGGATAIGFAGFWRFDGVGLVPKLVYALLPAFTSHGYASEISVALIDYARAQRALGEIEAAVDEPNIASCRVLAKLGFETYAEAPGAFGRMRLYRLPAARPPRVRRSARLILRPLGEEDLAAFAQMNADQEVMAHFPSTLTRAESDALAARIRAEFEERGYGLWALELPGSARFIGYTGLWHTTFASHVTPCVEIGWRLARAHWGQGYASEAARAALQVAFVHLGLSEVVSFTSLSNTRSQRVMERLGMHRNPAEDFDHPALFNGHPLQRHVLYRIGRTEWTCAHGLESARR